MAKVTKKTHYPMEDQLISIAAATPFVLTKDPYDMDEDEIDEAATEAEKYVHWIDSEDCYQAVPALLGSNTEIPCFEGGFADLKKSS